MGGKYGNSGTGARSAALAAQASKSSVDSAPRTAPATPSRDQKWRIVTTFRFQCTALQSKADVLDDAPEIVRQRRAARPAVSGELRCAVGLVVTAGRQRLEYVAATPREQPCRGVTDQRPCHRSWIETGIEPSAKLFRE